MDVLEIVFSREWDIHLFSILTWKYCVGCLVVYLSDLILGFFVGGESGEGGGVVGRMMIGDGVISAVWLALMSDGGRC